MFTLLLITSVINRNIDPKGTVDIWHWGGKSVKKLDSTNGQKQTTGCEDRGTILSWEETIAKSEGDKFTSYTPTGVESKSLLVHWDGPVTLMV